jgi:hypothetical protein
MFTESTPYDSNQHSAIPGCSHCAGVTTHEAWCSTRNVLVQYAFSAVLNNDLTIGDSLILHALGVKWDRSLPDVSSHERAAAQRGVLTIAVAARLANRLNVGITSSDSTSRTDTKV